jgi:hypothetical protein
MSPRCLAFMIFIPCWRQLAHELWRVFVGHKSLNAAIDHGTDRVTSCYLGTSGCRTTRGTGTPQCQEFRVWAAVEHQAIPRKTAKLRVTDIMVSSSR